MTRGGVRRGRGARPILNHPASRVLLRESRAEPGFGLSLHTRVTQRPKNAAQRPDDAPPRHVCRDATHYHDNIGVPTITLRENGSREHARARGSQQIAGQRAGLPREGQFLVQAVVQALAAVLDGHHHARHCVFQLLQHVSGVLVGSAAQVAALLVGAL